MASYRLYLRLHGTIVARQDFEADGDEPAQEIAAALFDACSDDCGSYDLWQGARLVPARIAHRKGLAELTEVHQEAVIRTEETIVHSEWAIAQSRRLIKQLEAAKKTRGD